MKRIALILLETFKVLAIAAFIAGFIAGAWSQIAAADVPSTTSKVTTLVVFEDGTMFLIETPVSHAKEEAIAMCLLTADPGFEVPETMTCLYLIDLIIDDDGSTILKVEGREVQLKEKARVAS